ncbi:hypothetical protein ACIP4Y_05350 [Streptomyces sp. NPDC088810]|uniref:hypothetical protein n=1 Tax=Streptomyces sp. NPDC088810 TaxID=3365904 RepID=UPI0037F8A21B
MSRALGAAVIGTVFFGAAGEGLGEALSDAMSWVVGVFAVCAVLCAALPRRAVTDHEG